MATHTVQQRRELAMVATEAAMAQVTEPEAHARLERRNALLAVEDQDRTRLQTGARYDERGIVSLEHDAVGRLDELLLDPEHVAPSAVVMRAAARVEVLADLLWLGDVDQGLWMPTDDFSNCADLPWWGARLHTWLVTMAQARATWPRGPWDEEPDRHTFVTRARLPGLIVRREDGVLCGYVTAASDRLGYASGVRAVRAPQYPAGSEIFLPQCAGVVCHLPARDEQGRRPWLGFHCGGVNDIIPGGPDRTTRMRYRDMAHVRHEVEILAEQVMNNQPWPTPAPHERPGPPPPTRMPRITNYERPAPPPDRSPSPGHLGEEGGRTGPPRFRR